MGIGMCVFFQIQITLEGLSTAHTFESRACFNVWPCIPVYSTNKILFIMFSVYFYKTKRFFTKQKDRSRSRSRRKIFNMGRKNKQRFSSITKDRDEIQTQIEKADEAGKPIVFEYDDELPGGGQFYAIETGQHFTDAKALADHKKGRYFKKRAKELKEEKYTQGSAEWASGMTKEKLPPAHPVK